MPVVTRAPNSSSHSSTGSRRETRLRTDSVAIAACKPRPQRARSDLRWQLACSPPPATGAAHPLALMLDHPRRDPRQLLNLVTRRLTSPPPGRPRRTRDHTRTRTASARSPHPPPSSATAHARAPHDPAGRPACDPTGPCSAAARFRAAPARRLQTSSASSSATPAQAVNPRGQLLDLTIHPQQHLDHDLAPRVKDRLRLAPLHATKFDSAKLCPPDQLNAYTLRRRP